MKWMYSIQYNWAPLSLTGVMDMRTGDLSRAIQHIRKAVFMENGQSMTDGHLLESFLARKEEARLLEVPEGTLSTRLLRGRALLAKRLSRHGFVLSGGWMAIALAQNAASAAVPPSLVKVTVKTGVLLAAGEVLSGGIISQT